MDIRTYRSQVQAVLAGENEYGERFVAVDVTNLTDYQRSALASYVSRRRNVNVTHYTQAAVIAALGCTESNEPIKEAALQNRIEKLERLVGKLTLENEFLKKAYQHKLRQQAKNRKSSKNTDMNSRLSAAV